MAAGLQVDDLLGPFQPKPFHNSVNTQKNTYCFKKIHKLKLLWYLKSTVAGATAKKKLFNKSNSKIVTCKKFDGSHHTYGL